MWWPVTPVPLTYLRGTVVLVGTGPVIPCTLTQTPQHRARARTGAITQDPLRDVGVFQSKPWGNLRAHQSRPCGDIAIQPPL